MTDAKPARPRTPRPLTPGLSRGARVRAYCTAGVMTLLFAAVAHHAWGIEVRDSDHYRTLADRQHVRTLEVAAPRGPILDLRGRALAVTALADSVFANPREVRDVAATADKLAHLLGLDVNELEDKLSSERHFTWLARLVTPDQARAVRDAKLPGVGVTPEPRRSYPGGAAAAPVLGLAGIDGKGLDGAELSLDKLLVGRRARFEAVRDARGKTLLEDGLTSAAPGATVTLTIDRTIQDIAAGALADSVRDNQAKAGVVVVIEIGTGRVLAIASAPTHDPDHPDGSGPRAVRNHAVADAYELGSVMKPFTVATALEDGVTTPDHVWDVENGAWRLGRKIIRDVDRDPVLTTSEIIKRSSNVGAAKIGLKLGRQRLHDGLVKFGFGGRTGIELPGEQSGMLRDGGTWRDIETATISFGYGLTVTPLQLAAAIATFAQGGRYVPPTIIEKVTGPGGVLIRIRTPKPRQVVSEQTATEVLAMLRSVFESGKHGGTAGHLVVPGFECGGKTGTAHKYDPATHHYSPHRYISSFAGLAPIDHPRIAVVAVVDEPLGGDYYGAKVAGPVFARVASETLRYLGVPGSPMAAADDHGKAAHPAPHGHAAAAAAPAAAPTPDPIDDATAPAAGPDFRGMSVAHAIDAARAAGVRLEVVGSGRAVSQEPVAAGPAPIIRVVFAERAASARTVDATPP